MIQSFLNEVPRELERRLRSPREASLISDSAHLGIFEADNFDGDDGDDFDGDDFDGDDFDGDDFEGDVAWGVLGVDFWVVRLLNTRSISRASSLACEVFM